AEAGAGAGATTAGTGAEPVPPQDPPVSIAETETHRVTELDSGLRVVTERVPSVRSIALGFGVRVGSRDESPEQAGLSHFLEHLLFKGTDRFSSTEIDQIFDGMGAEVNAGTGKETTMVYSRFLDQHLEHAIDVIADMVLRPTYPDIESERRVVVEEIAMYEDEPSDKVHDVLAGAVFGDHPLGRPIIGRADVIESVPVPYIAAYHDARYGLENLVVAAAGNVDHDRIVELAARHCAAAPGEGVDRDAVPGSHALDLAPERAPEAGAPGLRFHAKETEQYHLCLGGPGVSRADDRRFALRVLDTILGGSSSSRLFQEVREKRGLAYAVFSYSSQFVDSGQVTLYVGTRPENAGEAMEVIAAELGRLRAERVSEEELERAKENVKGRTVLAMESTFSRMSRLGSALLTGTPLLTLDETIERYDRVTLDEVTELAAELYAPDRLSAAGVGGDEERFRSAVGAVNPELAAA
ncbi:MAG TPA: pitrilysin family protein, partial [Thermoleophilaceae bacterium]|nr:pitrilysin family protein [Thermoleophilaceae bacterium]